MIRTRLGIILAERKLANVPPFTIVDIAERTGISRQTLYNFVNNVTTRYDADILDALCDALGVGLCDLLEHIPNAATD